VLPKFVAIAPDGTACGRASLREPPTLFLKLPPRAIRGLHLYDIWNHAVNNYGISDPNAEAQCLAGASMGAFGAYTSHQTRKHYGAVAACCLAQPRYAMSRAERHGFRPELHGLMTEIPTERTGRAIGFHDDDSPSGN